MPVVASVPPLRHARLGGVPSLVSRRQGVPLPHPPISTCNHLLTASPSGPPTPHPPTPTPTFSGIVLTDGAMADFEGSSKLAPRLYSEPVRLGGAPASRPGSAPGHPSAAPGPGTGPGTAPGTGAGLGGGGGGDVLDPPAAGVFSSPSPHASTKDRDRCALPGPCLAPACPCVYGTWPPALHPYGVSPPLSVPTCPCMAPCLPSLPACMVTGPCSLAPGPGPVICYDIISHAITIASHT